MVDEDVTTSRRARIGIMGGTFDPIHHGHLVAASEVQQQFELDEVVFVPTGEPYMKSTVSEGEHRYLMTVIATAANPRFTVSRVDIERHGPTYTVDTLLDMRAHYPNADLFFITGADAVAQILDWKDVERIWGLAHLVAVVASRASAHDERTAVGPRQLPRGPRTRDFIHRLPDPGGEGLAGLVSRAGRCRPVHRQTPVVSWSRMSSSNDLPLTRRAAREAARATGEQPSLQATGEQPASPGSGQLAVVLEEPPLTTGMIGPDGQVLTRRRLRELRGQDAPASEVRGQEPWAPERPAPSEEPVIAAPSVAAPSASIFAPPPEAPAEAPAQKPEWTAPEGHWTRQLEAVDEDDLLETTLSREVGLANPTTSALIIQEAPVSMDLGGPLDSTGEILLTGSIPLSPSLSTTGSVERLRDADADLDDLFDDHRLRETAQDAQPVRASAIASQHALGPRSSATAGPAAIAGSPSSSSWRALSPSSSPASSSPPSH